MNIAVVALKLFIYANLDNPDKGLNNVQIHDLYNHVMDKFAKILQTEILLNLINFMKASIQAGYWLCVALG